MTRRDATSSGKDHVDLHIEAERELVALKEKVRSNVTAASAMLGLPFGLTIEEFCEAVSELGTARSEIVAPAGPKEVRDALVIAERWKGIHSDESHGAAGKNLGTLARAVIALHADNIRAGAALVSATAKLPPEVAEILRSLCYVPWHYEEIRHLNYCRWCHYVEGHNHGPACVMSLYVERGSK